MLNNIHPTSGTTPVIMFGGSRTFAARSLVVSAVSAVLRSGASLSVGCAIGADALVIGAAVGAGAAARLRVSAVFGAGGAGAWSGSAVRVVAAAARAGAAVTWWAGGSAYVPLRARLVQRSAAALAGASAAVFFLSGAGSPGSLSVAALAVKRCMPVFAFCACQPQPLPRCVGSWVPCQFCSLPAWSWQPAATQPALV